MPAHPSCARIALPLLLPALAGIYISQTLLTALTTQALPALMREAGAALQVVGLTALWWLPWGLKFLWAPWVERLRLPAHRPARRSRPLLLGTQWTLAALLLALGAAGMAGGARALALTGGAWVATALLLAALAASVGDVVCDGFAIDQLPRHQHGWGNVVQAGGSYAGAMLGSGGFLLAVQALGGRRHLQARPQPSPCFRCPCWPCRSRRAPGRTAHRMRSRMHRKAPRRMRRKTAPAAGPARACCTRCAGRPCARGYCAWCFAWRGCG